MKNMLRCIAALALATLTALPAGAQEAQLSVSTGAASGNYARIYKELYGVCKDQISLVEKNSTGAVENMDRLVGNEVNAAFVQTDVLFFRQLTADLSTVKTLISLYPEEIHVITPTVSKIEQPSGGGISALTSKITGKVYLPFNTFVDLAGQNIAVWGGAIVTAQFIKLQSQVPFNIVEVTKFDEAKALIDSGQAAALLMVGGQPMGDVQKLSNAYKLVPFSEDIVGRLKNVYVPAKLNYSNMGQGGSGINTIATESLFVTRTYRTPRMMNALAALRACFKEQLPELQETTGTHQKWQVINSENKGKWPYYELPEVKVEIPAAPGKAPVRK